MAKKLKRHKAPWSNSELGTLRVWAETGQSARETARELGRTVGATKWQAMQQKVSFHAINQKHGVQKKLAKRRKLYGMTATLG